MPLESVQPLKATLSWKLSGMLTEAGPEFVRAAFVPSFVHPRNQRRYCGAMPEISEVSAEHRLPRQLGLRDLVLSQILTVVGSAWVGLAAGLGRAQLVVWLLAFAVFYFPMAV